MAPEDLPPEDEAVRQLLAAAAEPAQMPPEVAARLDDVLAGLVADRAPDSAPSPEVVDLAERRRRRRVPAAILAAAAVAVVALGVTNVLSGSGGGSTTSASAGGASDETATGSAKTLSAPSASAKDAPSPGAAGAQPTSSPDDSIRGMAGGLPRIHSGSLAADVQRIADSTADQSASKDASGPFPYFAADSHCSVPAHGRRADVIAVRLDGRLATLLFRAPNGGARAAEIYSCDEATAPVASTSARVR